MFSFKVMDKVMDCKTIASKGSYGCLNNLLESVQEMIDNGEILIVHQIRVWCVYHDISEYHPEKMLVGDLPDWLDRIFALCVTKSEIEPTAENETTTERSRKRPREFFNETLVDEHLTELFYGAENNPKNISKQTNDPVIRDSKQPSL